MDLSDQELLARFSKNRDERAFERIVTQYLPLALSVARRKGLSDDLASDVAQQVFLLLAQRPESIRPQEGLVAWVHCVSRTLAIRMGKAEKRRLVRESKAFHDMQDEASPNSTWEELAPFIDEAISRLRPIDRRIILMRFYENLSLEAVSMATGLSNEAIRKRISRGMERIRSTLGKKGITTSAAALATQLPAYSITPCPPGLAASICSSALLSATSTYTVTLTSIVIAMTTSTKLIIGGAAMVCLLIGVISVIPNSDSSDSTSATSKGKNEASQSQFPRDAGSRSSAGRARPINSKSPKRSFPLEEIRESLKNSNIKSSGFSDLGQNLASNFDLLMLTDRERLAVLQVANEAKKQLIEAEARLLKPQ